MNKSAGKNQKTWKSLCFRWIQELLTLRSNWKKQIKYINKQINQSISHKNVFRWFHFQDKPYQQAKYIWVESGKIYDIIVNVASNSNFYKKSLVIELDSKNNRHLFIPKGFAHGFISVMDNTKVCYAVDSFYNPSSDTGINFDDKSLEIDWPIDKSKLLISEKDKNLPFLNEK